MVRSSTRMPWSGPVTISGRDADGQRQAENDRLGASGAGQSGGLTELGEDDRGTVIGGAVDGQLPVDDPQQRSAVRTRREQAVAFVPTVVPDVYVVLGETAHDLARDAPAYRAPLETLRLHHHRLRIPRDRVDDLAPVVGLPDRVATIGALLVPGGVDRDVVAVSELPDLLHAGVGLVVLGARHPVLAPLDQQDLGRFDGLGPVGRARREERRLTGQGDLVVAEVGAAADHVADLVEVVLMLQHDERAMPTLEAHKENIVPNT